VIDNLSPEPIQKLGLEAFNILRAEDEPWLVDCYVPPAEFPLMVSARSALIFGAASSGKTALWLALERVWQEKEEDQAGWLLVSWPVNVLVSVSDASSGSDLVAWQQLQVFDAIARSLLSYLGQHPVLLQNAPDWACSILAWFIRRFLQGDDLQVYIESLLGGSVFPKEADSVFQKIDAMGNNNLLSKDAPPFLVMTELARSLSQINLSGVRIIMKDVEPWWEAYPTQLSENLRTFLSTLALFEHSAFAYTFLLPAGLWPVLSQTTGVKRRRVSVFQSCFQEQELVRIVERRLALALGRRKVTLADLGPDDVLRPWLAGCGGNSPRGWLETTYPFLAAYFARQDSSQPLTVKDCRKIQKQSPPSIWIRPDTGEVTVGWRQVTGLSKGQLAMLRYLSDHAGEFCSRKDLYRAYQKGYDPTYNEEKLLASDIRSVLDTALYRLREAIEPLPPRKRKVFFETKRDVGVRLRFPARE